jgi:nitrate/nitrite-specific signal transduction histidine kinase
MACREEMDELNTLVSDLEARVREQQTELEAAHRELNCPPVHQHQHAPTEFDIAQAARHAAHDQQQFRTPRERVRFLPPNGYL